MGIESDPEIVTPVETPQDPPLSRETMDPDLKEALYNGGKAVVSAAVTVGSVVVANKATERVNFQKLKKAELTKLERDVEVNVVKLGLGFSPSNNTNQLIQEAQQTIDTAAITLSIPTETLCNLRSFRQESLKLDEACTLVTFNNARIAERQAYLEQTSYAELVPYRNTDDGAEFAQFASIMVGAVGGIYSIITARRAYLSAKKWWNNSSQVQETTVEQENY
jgi:hypothetical protein